MSPVQTIIGLLTIICQLYKLLLILGHLYKLTLNYSTSPDPARLHFTFSYFQLLDDELVLSVPPALILSMEIYFSDLTLVTR